MATTIECICCRYICAITAKPDSLEDSTIICIRQHPGFQTVSGCMGPTTSILSASWKLHDASNSNKSSLAVMAEIFLQHTYCIFVATIEQWLYIHLKKVIVD